MPAKSAVSRPENGDLSVERSRDLVALAQEGEMDAIGALYDQHQESIFRYVWSRVSDRQMAEDLTGEVFTRMLAALPRFRSKATPFRAWLFRIARNLVIDHYRKHAKDKSAPIEQAADIAQDKKDEPSAVLEQVLIIEQLHGELSKLGTLQREVLILRFLNGLTIKEVSQVVDKTEAAVKALQHRGLSALRLSFEGVEEQVMK